MKRLPVNLLSHILASTICVVIFTATPILLYGFLVVIGILLMGDMGGPLNFILVPLFSIVLALITTYGILMPLTVILQWLSSRFKFSKWIPLWGIFPASFLIFVIVVFAIVKPYNIAATFILILIWCLVGSACFALYWILLNMAEIILDWLWKSIQSFTKRQSTPGI